MNRFLMMLLVVALHSCQPINKVSVDELFKADKEFSEMAEKIGYNKAFIEYAHQDAVLLRDDNLPLKGKQAITTLFEKANVEGVSFSWIPQAGDISQSGELGFTYGIYQYQKDSLIEKGTYVSIWKKDEMGNWKYILDSGNQGIGKY